VRIHGISRAFGLLVLGAVALTVASAPVLGQNDMVLGPRQFESDRSGKGAVLCVWSIYLSVQAKTSACGLPRRPADDAMDEAIAAMDEFILSNSSLRPTREMLEDFKRKAVAPDIGMARRNGVEKVCESADLDRFRRISPEKIRASAKELLAVPREPVMNPCL